jgi:alpha-N-arabinofuranosidase
MYSTAVGSWLVETTVQTGQYDVEQGVRRIPTIPSVPYLDVVSALNDSGTKLTLYCVNRNLTEEARATVRVSGFTAASARGQQLTASDLYAVNDDAQPEAVVPARAAVSAQGGQFRHTFPARSVTVIELRR